MLPKKQDYSESFELQIFRFTGVNLFRKLIFWLERVKHGKSDRKNENYHPFSFDVISLEKFNGFLLYNALLHIISLLFVVAYIVLSLIFDIRNTTVDVIVAVFLLLDIYCIALQRGSYLKTRVLCRRYYSRSFTNIMQCNRDVLQELYTEDPQKLRQDYEVIWRIRNAFEGHSDCILGVSDVESLKRICECVEPIAPKKNDQQDNRPAESGVIEECNSISSPYTALQLRIDRLQKALGISGRRMLDHTAIITENQECERLYRKLIPEDTVYNICFVCYQLYAVYTRSINNIRTDEL